jgi:HD-GYP domain-containing protein (c-di-GMP phosphodiesterase class II)
MISNRPYREARNLEWVMNEFRQCAGSHFDPEITDVFVKILSSQKIEMTHPTPILQHSS